MVAYDSTALLPTENVANLPMGPYGLGTHALWTSIGQELEGKTQLNKPRVSKQVLIKAMRLQANSMKFLLTEIDSINTKLNKLLVDREEAQKQSELMSSKILALQGHVGDMNADMNGIRGDVKKVASSLIKIDEVAALVHTTREGLHAIHDEVDNYHQEHEKFATQVNTEFNSVKEEAEVTKQFALKLEDRMDAEEKELFLGVDHILTKSNHSLEMWIDQVEKENKKKDEALRECTEKMSKQGKNIQDMILETRRAIDENNCAVEDVHRLLLDKADRKRMDELIESKYEELCNQVDKALSAALSDEEEFKRVSVELQALVTHLGESKADKKDLLEIKEQVLYDSRVRQQVENLRSFIDLKMNRDDVFSQLKTKADKDEIMALLKNLSEGMNASIAHAQNVIINEPENAFLTGKGVHGYNQDTQRRGQSNTNVMPGSGTVMGPNRQGMTLPYIEREKCLSCNAPIREPTRSTSQTGINKGAYPMAPVLGGGFQLPNTSTNSLDSPTERYQFQRTNQATHNNYVSPIGCKNVLLSPMKQQSNTKLTESASESLLLGVDGHVYQGDPEFAPNVRRTLHEKVSSSRSGTLPVVQNAREEIALESNDSEWMERYQ